MLDLTDGSVSTLREQLRAALLAGQPTATIRTRLAAAERDAAAAAAREATRQAEADQADAAHVAHVADALASKAIAGIRAVLAGLPPPPHHGTHMTDICSVHHAAIANASDALARAAAMERSIGEELRHAEGPRLQVEQRVRDLAAARAAIGARRAAGNPRSEDAGDLLAIALDTENLEVALAEAVAAVLPVRERAAVAARITFDARQRLGLAEAAAREAMLVEHAQACEAALLAAVGALQAASTTPRPIWGASPALRTALRDLAARRGEL